MRGILWHVTQKLEGIFDGILIEIHMRILEDKNQIQNRCTFPGTYPPVFMVYILLKNLNFLLYSTSLVPSSSLKQLVYMYLSQLMSTFTNYLKVHRSLDGYFIL